jgi:L-gulono-1,4-lactone dehydrogenase
MTRKAFTTWSGHHRCWPAKWGHPRTVEEVVAAVRHAAETGGRVKVVGAGHSWSDIACSDGTLLQLDGLTGILEEDRGAGTVTVAAGMRLEALNRELDARGLAMPSLGSISQQSVAGAVSTGTHGTGVGVGSLSALIERVVLVDGQGELRELGPEDGDLFQAARVGLGALGILVAVTLRVRPAFRLKEVATAYTFDEAVDQMEALSTSARHVKLWWLPHTERVVVYAWEPTDEPANWGPGATRMWAARQAADRVVNTRVFPVMLGLGRLFPGTVPAANRLTQEHYLVAGERVGRSDLIFNLAMPPVHREMEYGLPAHRASEGLRRLRGAIDSHGLRVNFIVEVRFVAADAILLSGSQGRPSCQLGAYMAECPDLPRYFGLFEEMCVAMDGRPHWGKEFYADGETLRRAWPDTWERFRAARAELDPHSVFDNAFLRRMFSDAS